MVELSATSRPFSSLTLMLPPSSILAPAPPPMAEAACWTMAEMASASPPGGAPSRPPSACTCIVAVASAGNPPSWKWKGPEEKEGLVVVVEVVEVLVAAVLCSGPVLEAVVAVEAEEAVAVAGLSLCSEGLSVSLPSILSISPLALRIMSLARLSLTSGLDCPMAPTEV